jgi:hypothetical protein
MDHDTAIRMQAAERYVLKEFAPEQQAEFEEHFFGCPECAQEVRSAAIFVANAAQVLREERASESAGWERSVGRPNWRFWWPLVASAALNLALLAGFGIEHFLGPNASAGMEPQFYQTVGVTAASRGTQPAVPVAKGAQFLGVRFDLLPGQHFESFEYRILDASGSAHSAKSLPAPSGEYSEMELAIPVKGLAPGNYVVMLRGRQSGNTTEIGRRNISIPR